MGIGIDATDGRRRNEAMMAEIWRPGMAARDCRRKGEGEPLGAILGTPSGTPHKAARVRGALSVGGVGLRDPYPASIISASIVESILFFHIRFHI